MILQFLPELHHFILNRLKQKNECMYELDIRKLELILRSGVNCLNAVDSVVYPIAIFSAAKKFFLPQQIATESHNIKRHGSKAIEYARDKK